MSREAMPKQLVPLVGGRSLLEMALDRLKGLVLRPNRYVCAGERHRAAILAAAPGMDADRFLGEPTGRDTLSAIGLGRPSLRPATPMPS
jgi:mannose-1-phosphate guanylyltransferase